MRVRLAMFAVLSLGSAVAAVTQHSGTTPTVRPSAAPVMASGSGYNSLREAKRASRSMWRRELRHRLAVAAKPKPVVQPAPRPTYTQQAVTYTSSGSVWDRIAECESSGNWADNTGNGYYGGLQMDMEFWHTYGGDAFAARPDLASRSAQIIVAERGRDGYQGIPARGYTPWPVCGRRA